ncbi:hypothetical protein ACFOEK_12260 [Litoribrevibacter euphylliae]|uniref:Class IIb bacteriocin, lactobin A/cerein 7B family n=1 Tax=Litoribrevibacter euphylliae TaxID=1834034 RepID=A0ABV7HD32_9GAMM
MLSHDVILSFGGGMLFGDLIYPGVGTVLGGVIGAWAGYEQYRKGTD